MIMQDANIGEKWIMGIGDLPVHFFANSCDFTIISK